MILTIYIIGFVITFMVFTVIFWMEETEGARVTVERFGQFLSEDGPFFILATLFAIVWPLALVALPFVILLGIIFLILKPVVWIVKEVSNPKENV